MRRLILMTGLLAAALMATPQPASAQSDQPIGGGGGARQPNPSDPLAGDRPSTRPSDESVGGGEMRRDAEPRTGGTPRMLPSDQPIGGGGGEHLPNPYPPRR